MDRLPSLTAVRYFAVAARLLSFTAAARELKVDLDHFCGGHCSCGTCRVFVVSGAEHLSPVQMNEEITLGAEAAKRGHRLACQAKAQGPVEVQIPDYFLAR